MTLLRTTSLIPIEFYSSERMAGAEERMAADGLIEPADDAMFTPFIQELCADDTRIWRATVEAEQTA